ncbi:MAG: GDP-L-fucose synthase [Flavobacteriales bacterium]|nr:GDP-L-fucose synthase [Flavobacteriales bacterium]
MNLQSKIYIAGHRGLVGTAIIKNLESRGYSNFITRTHSELDLTNQQEVADLFQEEKPDYVILAAARVGGIVANNTYRGEFIYDNLMIQNNVIHQSYLNGVKKLLFLGSTCIYPKNSPQPMKEEYLLTSELEYTNEPYAIAKIAGIKMCESYNIQYHTNFISVQPTNLYGPNDNFDLEKSHVLPALIRKMHLGKALENNDWNAIREDLKKLPIEGVNQNSSEDDIVSILDKYGIKRHSNNSTPNTKQKTLIEIWGSGKPMREFLWSEDMADACVHLMENIDFTDIIESQEPKAKNQNLEVENCKASLNESQKPKAKSQELKNTHINIGTGKEVSIKELSETIKDIIGFKGELFFNTEKPDGTMRKLTDSSKLESLGWKYKIDLSEGIEKMYNWYTQ